MRVNPRVVTALVSMLLILGVSVYGSTGLFAGLCGAVVLVGVWEWAGLAGVRRRRDRGLVLLCAALLLLACYPGMNGVLPRLLAAVSLLWWAMALILIVRRQKGKMFAPGRPSQAAIGALVLLPAWCSLVLLHSRSAPGDPILVSCLFILIWSADTGAYYVGRKWGRTRLASLVSPGKTWEGLGGALVSGLLAGAVCAGLLQMSPSMFALFLLVCLVTINMSVVGDLTESLLKRAGGVKDSGTLFPGHGGALDRIDSLTAAAPFFLAGIWLLERAG